MFVNNLTGRLRIRDASAQKFYNIYGVNSTIDSEQTAATQANKIFDIAGLSVVGDSQTTFTIEKVVSDNG